MNSGAEFSHCKKYRYKLWRIWDNTKPLLAFCMLNPSTADAVDNDPTVERCQRRAEQMGYGGVIVVNLFAFRSTDPKGLKKKSVEPVGYLNNMAIVDVAQVADTMICGWGKHGSLNGRDQEVLSMLKFWVPKRKIRALKLNKDGSPSHPLYIGYDVKPVPIDFCKSR